MLKNENSIFNIASESDFNALCLSVFQYQHQNNSVYRDWVTALKINPDSITNATEIPFLPIEFFKSKKVITGSFSNKITIFKSSSTTSQTPSTHYVNNLGLYEKSFLSGFKLFYGEPWEYCILALLPSYLERKDSSLVYMCNKLISQSRHPKSGFFLNNYDELETTINELKSNKQKTLLMGVSYALLDLCEKGVKLGENFIVMETGGMKGRRKEILKAELHQLLKEKLGVSKIHGEYGMTELLSQAYSVGEGLYDCPPWMRFFIRDKEDPLTILPYNITGGINIIDLANINSCSFIATKDLGRLSSEGKLELLGRYDNSDVRGCNLMMGEI